MNTAPDNFYVTLPSNSTMKHFNNKMNEYTTILAEPFELKSKYEVALTELTYSQNFSIEIGNIFIPESILNEKYISLSRSPYRDSQKEKLTIINGISSQDFCDQLNELIEDHLITEDIILRNHLCYDQTTDIVLEAVFNKIKVIKPLIDLNKAEKLFFPVFKTKLKNETYFKKDSLEYKDLIQSYIKHNNIEILEEADKSKLNVEIYVFLDAKDSKLAESYKKNNGHYSDLKKKWILPTIKDFDYSPIVFECEEEFNEENKQIIINNSKARYIDHKINGILINFDFQTDIFNETPYRQTFSIPNFPKFEYNEKFNKLRYIASGLNQIKINGLAAEIVFKDEYKGDAIEFFPHRLYQIPKTFDIITYIVVHTDIIDLQLFGDVYANILKVIPVHPNTNSNHLVSYFENPHYVKCRTSILDKITITLRDINGNKIRFEESYLFVIAKLHFRKI